MLYKVFLLMPYWAETKLKPKYFSILRFVNFSLSIYENNFCFIWPFATFDLATLMSMADMQEVVFKMSIQM